MLQLGKEQVVRVAQKQWKLGRLTEGVINNFRDWISERVGDPYEAPLRIAERCSREYADQLFREAKEVDDALKHFSIASPLAQSYLATETGSAKLLHEMMLVNHPDATLDDAMELAVHIGQQKLATTLERASGTIPDAGKAPAPAA